MCKVMSSESLAGRHFCGYSKRLTSKAKALISSEQPIRVLQEFGGGLGEPLVNLFSFMVQCCRHRCAL